MDKPQTKNETDFSITDNWHKLSKQLRKDFSLLTVMDLKYDNNKVDELLLKIKQRLNINHEDAINIIEKTRINTYHQDIIDFNARLNLESADLRTIEKENEWSNSDYLS